MKHLFYICIVLLVFSTYGCSHTSAIQKVSESESHFKDALYKGHDFYDSGIEVEGEKYRVYHRAATGFVPTAALRGSAEERANNFCRKQDPNKKMLALKEHTAKPPYILGNFPRIEIIFACVDSDKLSEARGVSAPEQESLEDKLATLNKLLSDGLISPADYEEQKKKLLNNYTEK